MAAHLSYEDQKKSVFKGLMLLGAITLVEVFIALLAKGHLIHGVEFKHGIGHGLYMLLMVGFSVYKAYFIIFQFMHMAHEMKGLALSVLLPTMLLIWAIIAFFHEGTVWGRRREQIKGFNETPAQSSPTGKPSGYVIPGTVLYQRG